jgi:hypothetical protein
MQVIQQPHEAHDPSQQYKTKKKNRRNNVYKHGSFTLERRMPQAKLFSIGSRESCRFLPFIARSGREATYLEL